jgi:predicted ATPase
VLQFNRALDQIATLPVTPALRHEQLEIQIALLSPLGHIKGFGAPETKAAVERARVLIEQAEALGEPSLQKFSVLFGLWVANLLTFNGDAICQLAAQYLALAKERGAAIQLMTGHRIMGTSLMSTGHIASGRVEFDKGIALYDSAKHRPRTTRFGSDVRVALLVCRSWALWMLGYPEAALGDTDHALREAREIKQTATSIFALLHAPLPYICSGNYATGNTVVDELIALSDEKGAEQHKAAGMLFRGCLLAMTGKASDAVRVATAGISTFLSGQTMWTPFFLAYLAKAYADLGHVDDARRRIGEAIRTIEATKEKWCEAEVNLVAGELALKPAEPDAEKAQTYFEQALSLARLQQAKSWELRAAMSLARLWRDQGKVSEARELLVPVYGWFTEGFDTRDLKEAKRLLEQLAA